MFFWTLIDWKRQYLSVPDVELMIDSDDNGSNQTEIITNSSEGFELI